MNRRCDGIWNILTKRQNKSEELEGERPTSASQSRRSTSGKIWRWGKSNGSRVVADLIEPHEVILLDGGTTTLEVARALVGKPLQVVTNSMPIVGLFVNQPNIELIVVGGYVYPKTGVALGDLAVAMLKNVHARRLVMSVGGITEAGLFNSNSLLVETERQMLSAAEEVIVVTDSSKFGHRALAHLAVDLGASHGC